MHSWVLHHSLTADAPTELSSRLSNNRQSAGGSSLCAPHLHVYQNKSEGSLKNLTQNYQY